MKPGSLKTARATPLRRKKSWREKLEDDKDLPKVITLKDGTSLAIPAPREVDGLMRTVPHGRLATIDELRAAVARRHGAESGCRITVGIFAWISANAAHEAEEEGRLEITPYWRILKSKGEVNPKYPGGVAGLTARLQAEGHLVFQRGKRFFVRDHEKAIVEFPDHRTART